MTQPDTQDWEDIVPRGEEAEKVVEKTTAKVGPFSVARHVDGYAFTQNPESPELRYGRQPQGQVPVPPRRQPPKRVGDQVRATGVWQPGGSARTEQPQLQAPRPNVVKALLSGLIPLVLLVGGVYLVMRLYQ
jgi:hypothetical protein